LCDLEVRAGASSVFEIVTFTFQPGASLLPPNMSMANNSVAANSLAQTVQNIMSTTAGKYSVHLITVS